MDTAHLGPKPDTPDEDADRTAGPGVGRARGPRHDLPERIAISQIEAPPPPSLSSPGAGDLAQGALAGLLLAGKYRLKTRIGEGGMGSVYLATQEPLGRDVVVKVIRPEYSLNADHRERFEREARAIAGLNHPNIVSVYDFGTTSDGTLFLAMERLKGKTLLQELVDTGAMPEDRIFHVVKSICRALSEVHALGIIHRDLKPENVFITTTASGEEVVKVLDFGLAKTTANGAATQQSAIVGTPGYMSPEQLRGLDISPATDVYALGVIWWEMLTGARVFGDEHNSHARLMRHVMDDAPAPTSVTDRPLTPGHEALVLRFVARSLSRRPKDARECLALVDAVSATFVRNTPAPKPLPLPWDATTTPGRRLTPARVNAPQPLSSVPSSSLIGSLLARPAFAAGGVAAVVIVVAIVAALWRASAPPEVTAARAPAAAQGTPPLLPGGSARRVHITSTPPGAWVFRVDRRVPLGGPTPLTLDIPDGVTTVSVEHPGHDPVLLDVTHDDLHARLPPLAPPVPPMPATTAPTVATTVPTVATTAPTAARAVQKPTRPARPSFDDVDEGALMLPPPTSIAPTTQPPTSTQTSAPRSVVIDPWSQTK